MSEIVSAEVRAQYRFWTEEKLRNADTDQQGHINNAVLSTLYEAGRIDLLAAPEIAKIRAATSIVVVRMLVNFRKELFFPGKAWVGTRVARVGRTSLDFEQAVFAANGEVSSAEATCVLLDRAARKPTPVPDELRAYLTGR
jgi:acyl-CoA thioester hydrolase